MDQDNNKKPFVIFTNDKIHAKFVRLVGDNIEGIVGVIPNSKAQEIAKSKNLDLVQISYSNGVSVCKIVDYGKFLYDQKKKQKQQNKQNKQNKQDLKEICFSIRIDDGDKNTKINHIKKFLADNCKVKLTVKFSYKEMSMFDYGRNILKNIVLSLNNNPDPIVFEATPKLFGRDYSCIIKRGVKKS